MENPVFVDNQDGNTLAQALADALGAADAAPDELRIATGFFSPSGFARVADNLRAVPDVRLMIGVDLGGLSSGRRKLGETDAAFERRRLRVELRRADEALWDERDRMPFSRASRAALRHLVAGLTAGNIAVRRYERGFLHAKAYILGGESDGGAERRGVLAGSSNLTVAGLTSNLELNLGRYDAPVVDRARRWFDELWDEAEDYDLVIAFEDALRPRTPWEIFIRVLWQLYGDEVEEDTRADENLPLTSFQKHGVARALRLIRDMGGVVVADEVGLGKTYIAGEILQVYREQRQRALLICPASVRDNVWKTFMNRFEFYVECLSFEQLAQDKQLKDKQRPNATSQHLLRPVEEYQLVVVDEAHNYRNPDAPTRAAALSKLLYGAPRDVVLLTATPVNNSLWDLYHLLRFFIRQDAHFADRGILSIKERFDAAMAEDPTSLSPDVLFPIIDATTVKRTRQFVKKHYERDTIVGPDGTPLPIVFPRPIARTVRYGLEERVNLQQCGNIVNFGLPWNPMRLVQRHGRIDRIGSPHDNVYLRTIFPAEELDRLLNLEQRILEKLAQAAAAVGVVAPVEGAKGGSQVFTETRDEIEKLLSEDTTLYERGGTAGAAQTGEEYRQTLRKELATNRDAIVNLPRMVGSGMVRGSRRGVFFCAAVGERTYLRFVPADESWAVAIEEDMVRETGGCLRIIECEPDTPTWFAERLQDSAYDFWDAARRDILAAWMVETDPANLQPRVRPLNHRVADYMRANEPAGVPQERIERALDILESPWPRREEIMLREWFESHSGSDAQSTEFLVEQILATGLEPVDPPEPLPPTSDEDIELVCWLGIEAGDCQDILGA